MTAEISTAARYVAVVSGNPRPASRTIGAARTAADKIGKDLGIADIVTIDLATFSTEILASEHPSADRAKETLAGATVAVIASPVYKASYTGLLKAFLDLYPSDGLLGVVTVPLVTSGSAAHALAGEVHLRPLLVELGATVPSRSLTLTERELAELDSAVDAWWERAGEPMRRAVGHPAPIS